MSCDEYLAPIGTDGLSSPLANSPTPSPDPPHEPATALPTPPPFAGSAPAPHVVLPTVTPPAAEAIGAEDAGGDRLSKFGEWIDESGVGAWLVSAVAHATLVVTLSLAILATPAIREQLSEATIEIAPSYAVEELDVGPGEIPLEPSELSPPSLGPFEMGDEISMPGERSDAIGSPLGEELVPQIGGTLTQGEAKIAAPSPFGTGASLASTSGGGAGAGIPGPFETLTNPLASRGGGMEGRKLANRRAAALAGGGTPQSEAAVEGALAWFAEHQLDDGGWQFDLKDCPKCNGSCRDSGSNSSRTAATGLALLCYLGAGYTHHEGKYQEVVGDGIDFLEEKMIISSHGGDLRDGDTMYSQGIATLALTEAYAMTHDRSIRQSALQAIEFILEAQYNDGGWRYTPNWEAPMAGDTTVSGWQIAALRSASLTDIELPSDLWTSIGSYLDSVQYDDGMNYLYVQGDSPTRRTASTPIGLLCRMICGWQKNYRPLRMSVVRIGQVSPNSKDVYFNYYASQVLHHVGGPSWKRWNPRMREYLISAQATEGHENGSWYFSEPHSSAGGRLYSTAMATMTLEVYYRYMPLYKETFVDQAPEETAEKAEAEPTEPID